MALTAKYTLQDMPGFDSKHDYPTSRMKKYKLLIGSTRDYKPIEHLLNENVETRVTFLLPTTDLKMEDHPHVPVVRKKYRDFLNEQLYYQMCHHLNKKNVEISKTAVLKYMKKISNIYDQLIEVNVKRGINRKWILDPLKKKA